MVDIVSRTKYVDDMEKRKRMGRPPLPKAERKSVRLSFRVTAAMYKAVAEAAKQEGKSVGRFVNETLETRLKGGK
jgi:predicted HicB family RNase H-like nuclease